MKGVFLMAKTNAEKQRDYRERQKAKALAEQEKKEREKEYNREYNLTHPRTRNFATVVYPDSAPSDWVERIIQYHVACLISPLHDKDVNPDGEIKKPHYHVLFIFETPKDFENQVKPMFDYIGGVGRELVNSARGYARYLCHLDNPEKYQYDTKEIKQYGGADYLSLTNLPTDDIFQLKEIFSFIRTNQITSFALLMDYCAEYRPEWFSTIATSRGYIVDKYIKSYAWELENPQTIELSNVKGK